MWRVQIAGQFCPPPPPYGSNWGHKIADFEFLAYISFIVAFIASECIMRYWKTICGESKYLVSFVVLGVLPDVCYCFKLLSFLRLFL